MREILHDIGTSIGAVLTGVLVGVFTALWAWLFGRGVDPTMQPRAPSSTPTLSDTERDRRDLVEMMVESLGQMYRESEHENNKLYGEVAELKATLKSVEDKINERVAAAIQPYQKQIDDLAAAGERKQVQINELKVGMATLQRELNLAKRAFNDEQGLKEAWRAIATQKNVELKQQASDILRLVEFNRWLVVIALNSKWQPSIAAKASPTVATGVYGVKWWDGVRGTDPKVFH
jgi:hypothetical protein